MLRLASNTCHFICVNLSIYLNDRLLYHSGLFNVVSDKGAANSRCLVSVCLSLYCSCQYFAFEHSPGYQKVQFSFWEAVETFDPNAIGVSWHTVLT